MFIVKIHVHDDKQRRLSTQQSPMTFDTRDDAEKAARQMQTTLKAWLGDSPYFSDADFKFEVLPSVQP